MELLRDHSKAVLSKNFLTADNRVQGSKACIIQVYFIGRNPLCDQVIFKSGGFIISAIAIVPTDQ